MIAARLFLKRLVRASPTQLPDLLREAAHDYRLRAADPLNRLLDNNPFITQEWEIAAEEVDRMADQLERRLLALFQSR